MLICIHFYFTDELALHEVGEEELGNGIMINMQIPTGDPPINDPTEVHTELLTNTSVTSNQPFSPNLQSNLFAISINDITGKFNYLQILFY